MSTLKKLVLIANFPADRQESMQRFAETLAKGFAGRGIAVETWRPDAFFIKLVRAYRYGGLPKYLGYLDKFVRFPRAIQRRLRQHADGTVYHIVDHANAVYAAHFRDVPLVVTCHDLLQIRSALGEFPQNPLSRSGRRYQQWILKNLAALRCVACVSEKTRDDLLRLARLPDTAATVIHNGLNYSYRPMPRDEAGRLLEAALARENLAWPGNGGGARPRFFFHIGGAQWYKNRTGLISIFGELHRLLATPRILLHVGPPLDPEQTEIVARLGLGASILHVSHLTNEELRAAYSLADGLIFPSWEEGFGWPIAEAQACGCPVFCSNRAPLTEVGGDAACTFDPADPIGAAAVIARGLESADTLRDRGLRRATQWSTAAMLDRYAALYNLIGARTRDAIISAS